jgi:uncharacterized protein
MSLARRHQLITFFVLAYALSWWPWPLFGTFLGGQPIVAIGPFLAAIIVTALIASTAGLKALLSRMVRRSAGHSRCGLCFCGIAEPRLWR